MKVRNLWIRRRFALIVVVLVVLGAPMIAFALAGSSALHAVSWGTMIGIGAIVGSIAVAEILVPKSFLRWRTWISEGAPSSYVQIGIGFERVLASNEHGLMRVRVFGCLLLFLLFGMEIILWIVSGL